MRRVEGPICTVYWSYGSIGRTRTSCVVYAKTWNHTIVNFHQYFADVEKRKYGGVSVSGVCAGGALQVVTRRNSPPFVFVDGDGGSLDDFTGITPSFLKAGPNARAARA